MVECLPGPPAGKCAVAAITQHIPCGGQTVVLQRFVADPVIVSQLMYLDGSPKGEDARPRA